ncbi:MAG: SRPBCC family protein [Polyangiaceae bacterium]
MALALAGAGCAPLGPGAAPVAAPAAPAVVEQLAPEPGFTREQQAVLRSGQTVEHAVSFHRHGRSYVGGVSYLLVNAEPRRVFDVLNNLPTLREVLPRTRRTDVIDRQDDSVRVELEMGNDMVSTTYTVFFALEPAQAASEGHLVRFWLDPSRPHSIGDVWGFFRATPFHDGRTLVVVGAAVDLGQGLIRMLFETRIQRTILRMPRRIRDTIEGPSGLALSRVAAQGQAAPEPPPEPASR